MLEITVMEFRVDGFWRVDHQQGIGWNMVKNRGLKSVIVLMIDLGQKGYLGMLSDASLGKGLKLANRLYSVTPELES